MSERHARIDSRFWPYLSPALRGIDEDLASLESGGTDPPAGDLLNRIEALEARLSRWPEQAPPTLPFEDRLGVSFSASGQTATYHVWADSLTAGAGLLIWLHGDGAYEHANPTSSYVFGGADGVVAQARERGYITISAKTPSGDDTWWNLGLSRANYLLALVDHLRRGYAVHPARVILAGYSGGAQQVTQYFMNRYGEAMSAGGGLVAFGGGQRPDTTMQYSHAVKTRVPVRWVVGENDTAANSPENFDARGIATTAEAWYRAQGFEDTGLDLLAGTGHELGGRFGALLGDVIDQWGYSLTSEPAP